MYLETIQSHDGKLMIHGTIIEWYDSNSFLFVACGKKLRQAFYCNRDFWKVVCGEVKPFGIIHVK